MNARVSNPRWSAVLVSCAFGMAIGGVGVVKLRTEVRRAGYELSEIEKQAHDLRLEVDQLRRAEQSLASPGRILELASKRGFTKVTPRDRIVVDPVLARMHPETPRSNR